MENGNQPQTDDISHMSPYLHFGHISPLYLALEVKKAGSRRLVAAAVRIAQRARTLASRRLLWRAALFL